MQQEVVLISKTNNGELELLPPHPRLACEECGKRFTSKSLVINKRTGKKVCRNCNNRLGSNPFYSPQKLTHPRDRVEKYSISDSEKRVLGFSKSRKVSRWLNNLRNRKKMQQRGDMGKIEIREKTNEKFLEGLGQK